MHFEHLRNSQLTVLQITDLCPYKPHEYLRKLQNVFLKITAREYRTKSQVQKWPWSDYNSKSIYEKD